MYINKKIYQPKGGMCSTCARKYDDCSHLHFSEMPVISELSKSVYIVRCVEHEKEKIDKDTSHTD